jgi:hypothetical protein
MASDMKSEMTFDSLADVAVVSELEQHTRVITTPVESIEDSWVSAEPAESLESFALRCPPSTTPKAWITTSHSGRERLVEERYGPKVDSTVIQEAWSTSEQKSIEALTEILKRHKFGSGKWMIFASWSDVDRVWCKVVSALWDGKLGSSAKVSGASDDDRETHVICVYVDPYWDVREVRSQHSNPGPEHYAIMLFMLTYRVRPLMPAG